MRFRLLLLIFCMGTIHGTAFSDDTVSPAGSGSNVDLQGEKAAAEECSEGGMGEPVSILMNVPHQGTVCADGTSHYSLTVVKRGDISIEVTGLSGDAALVYYGQDSTYTEWTTASNGPVPYVEDFFVEAGTTVFFAVTTGRIRNSIIQLLEPEEGESSVMEEQPEESPVPSEPVGEHRPSGGGSMETGGCHAVGAHPITYTIRAAEDFILSPAGIRIQGEIYTRAYELKPGGTYIQTVSADGLNYYRTVIDKGPNLRVLVKNLSENADLLWFDTQSGGYSGARSMRDGTTVQLEVYDLEPGSVCLYYISGDPDLLGTDSSFTVSVSEFEAP
jgi:hypothetical protein